MNMRYIIFLGILVMSGAYAMKRRASYAPSPPFSPAEERMRVREELRMRQQLEQPSKRKRRLRFSGINPQLEQYLWEMNIPVDTREERVEFLNNVTPDQVKVLNEFAESVGVGLHSVTLTRYDKELYDRFPAFIKDGLKQYIGNTPLSKTVYTLESTEIDEATTQEENDTIELEDN